MLGWRGLDYGAFDGRFSVDFGVDFGSVNRDVARSFDAKSNLIAFDRDDHDSNIIADDDRLVRLAG